jgi:hypothetical protein
MNDDYAIRDVIFPVCAVKLLPSEGKHYKIDRDKFKLLGTGFFIGDSKYFLSASHIFEYHGDGKIVAMFTKNGTEWSFCPIDKYEIHPVHDVAIGKLLFLPDVYVRSPIKISQIMPVSTYQFDMWSYPVTVANEMAKLQNAVDVTEFVPDLVYQSGYVRRRYAYNLPFYFARGNRYIEINEVGGSCASGAPLIEKLNRDQSRWNLLGVYVAEQTSSHPKIGYAVPIDVLLDWVPSMVGKRLIELE